MAEFPALPFFTDAYLSDTRHLTTLQHGAYFLMLMTAWRSRDCALPNDDVYLARIAGMDRRTWAHNKDTLLSFWKLNAEQKWVQGRLLDERKYVEQVSSKNSVAGKASALKRNNRHSTSVQPERNQASTPTPTPTPIMSSESKLSSDTRGARAGPYTPAFEEFWAEYPRHDCSKAEAAKSYHQIVKQGESHGRIINGVRAFRGYVERTRTGQRFVPHAATWLNQRRWESDYSEIRPYLDTPAEPAKSKWRTEGERLAAKYRAADALERGQGQTGGGSLPSL